MSLAVILFVSSLFTQDVQQDLHPRGEFRIAIVTKIARIATSKVARPNTIAIVSLVETDV